MFINVTVSTISTFFPLFVPLFLHSPFLMVIINALLQAAVPTRNTCLQSLLTGFAKGALMIFLDTSPVFKPPAHMEPMEVWAYLAIHTNRSWSFDTFVAIVLQSYFKKWFLWIIILKWILAICLKSGSWVFEQVHHNYTSANWNQGG